LKKIVFISILFSLFGSVVFAQSEDGKAKSGSAYSQLGIGYPVDMANTASRSMGLLGISYNETFVGSFANPAHWGGTIYGLGVGGIGIQSYNASSAAADAKNSKFSVNEFQLQLPIIRDKFGISGSFSPVTNADFRTFEEGTRYIGEGAEQDTLNFGIENRGSGGANRAELGFGWKINSNISIGYAASLVFMSVDDAFTAAFPQPSFRTANFTLETSGVGFGNRLGTSIQLPGFFQSNDQLGIGASVTLPVTLDAERKQTGTIAGSGVNVTDELQDGEGTIKIPMKISGGLSYSPSDLLMIGAEGFYQGWSNYQNDFEPDEEEVFTDRYKLGLGLQYFPYVTGSNKFLSSFKYRVGTSYDTGHIRMEGQKINTLKFSLGLGIRSPSSNSSVDLSFEYGIRGTTSTNLVKEQIWGMRLSLNLAEIMFFRPKLQ
jgi:hypothetical protein